MAMLLHNASAKERMRALQISWVVTVPHQRGLSFLHGVGGEHHDRLLSLLCHVLSLESYLRKVITTLAALARHANSPMLSAGKAPV